MNKIHTIFLLLFCTAKSFLINFNPASESIDKYKICKNCIHIIDKDNQCRQFGTVDVVSGRVNHFACSVVRSEELLCGPVAKFYTRQIPFNATSNPL